MNSVEIISYLQRITPWHFELEFKRPWGALQSNYRLQIRKELQSRYLFKNDVMDLSERPLPLQGSISISHCDTLGGFVFCQDRHVGLDIEEVKRIREDIALRVALDAEIERNFPVTLFWPAKEAAFKAAQSLGIKVLKQIEVLSLQEVDQQKYRFKATVTNSNALIEGVCLQLDQELVLSIAWLKATRLT